MAIQMDFQFKGITIPNGYIRVSHIDGNKRIMYFNLQYYTNKAESDADAVLNRPDNAILVSPMYSIEPDLTSEKNFIEQMYDYLMTLPEFSNAIEV